MVAADSPIRTLDDLVAKFGADPGSVSWGGFTFGSPDHLLCASVVKAIGSDITRMSHVIAIAAGMPFGAAGITDLLRIERLSTS